RSISLSPDGKRLAVTFMPFWAGPDRVCVHDTATGEQLLLLDDPPGGGRAALFSPDGKDLLLSPDFYHLEPPAIETPPSRVVILDAATGKLKKALYTGEDDQVTARWHPGGKLVYIREH